MTLFLISQVPFFSFFISFAKTLPLTIFKMKFLTQQVALDKSFSDETDYRNSIKDEITFFPFRYQIDVTKLQRQAIIQVT